MTRRDERPARWSRRRRRQQSEVSSEALRNPVPAGTEDMPTTPRPRNRRPSDPPRNEDFSEATRNLTHAITDNALATPCTRNRRPRDRPRRYHLADPSPRRPQHETLEERLLRSDEGWIPGERSRCIALDCEMVGVGPGGATSALARVAVVDWRGCVLYDKYVMVGEPVTDYRTEFSGITPAHLCSEGAVDFERCREDVVTLLNGMIVVGHGLRNDFTALRLSHPWHDVRDTTRYLPFTCRVADGTAVPRKLRDLTAERLGVEVQVSSGGHSPVEDGRAAMALYSLVRVKWESVVAYKVRRTAEIQKETKAQIPGSPVCVGALGMLETVPPVTI